MNPIEQAQQATRTAGERFLKTFAAVPDDKLTWSPASTAKSALQIAAHAGTSNEFLAAVLRGADAAKLHAEEEAIEKGITTREQAVRLIEESTAAVVDAIASLTPDRLGDTVVTPFLTAPMAFFIALPAIHLHGHASQIDYLQTIWGDMEFHM